MSGSSALRISREGWILLVILATLWGGSFTFNELGLMGVSSFTVTIGRLTIGALVLGTFCLVTGRWRMRLTLPQVGGYAFLGLIACAIPFNLYAYGQQYITGSLASIYNALTPIATIVVAHLLTKDERLSPTKVVGILCGLAGVFVLIGFDVDSIYDTALIGQVLCALPPFFYAFGIVVARKMGRWQLGAARSSFLQVFFGTLIAIPLGYIFVDPLAELQASFTHPAMVQVWIGLVGIGVLSTGVAYLIYFRLIETVGAVNFSLVTYLIPVAAILLGTVFLGERLTATDFAGAGIILLGVVIIDGRVARLLGAGRHSSRP
ncbi:MAG: DMT family transporter [Alphaproteobacteria bacterium]|nr:DMT family transporter [Alphaproteobacteria bacterium]